MTAKKRVLITGAAGHVGGVLTQGLGGYYNLVLTDIRKPTDPPEHPFIQADISDLASVRGACQDIDTVVHLAGDPRPTAPWDSLLPCNIIGAYNVFQAANEAGCKRVIFASSGNVVLGYPKHVRPNVKMPVRPPNLYGATKVWGEALARVYADQKGLSCICLRLGWVKRRDSDDIYPAQPMLDQILTYGDLTKLFVASIEAPYDLRFGIFHGISNNRWKRFDISNTRRVLGYNPEDDAFVLAGLIHSTWWRFRRGRVARWLKQRLRSGSATDN